MSSQSNIFNPTERTSAATGDGFSCPRLTTVGRLAIGFGASDAGMMVYDTTFNNLFIWSGAGWESIPANGDAGSNGSVQYNDNGIVAGAPDFTYNKATGAVGVAGPLTIGSLASLSATANALVINSNKATFTVVSDGLNNAAGTTITYGWTNGGQGPLIISRSAGETARFDASGNFVLGGTTAVQRFTIGGTLATSAGLTQRTTQTTFDIIPSNTAAGGLDISLGWIAGGQGPMKFNLNGVEAARFDSVRNFIPTLNTAVPALATNGQLVFNLTTDTNLRISVRGTDGSTRTANITLT